MSAMTHRPLFVQAVVLLGLAAAAVTGACVDGPTTRASTPHTARSAGVAAVARTASTSAVPIVTPTPSAAATVEHRAQVDGAPSEEVKVAFLGDTGMGDAFRRNLQTILDEQADFVVHVGDFDYEGAPEQFWSVIDEQLGHPYPYLLAVGNHDSWSWPAYASHMLEHLSQNDLSLDDLDLTDEAYATRVRGVQLVVVGQNGHNAEFSRFLDTELDEADPGWKLCAWHKNQQAMQLGRKRDEMGWDVYETCRLKGALIVTGHEHSYERTRTLLSMQHQTVDPLCAHPNELCVGPGRTFAIVQGLGGHSVRSQRRCLPTSYPYGCKGEWAFAYCEQQQATFGTLFIVFNDGGDPHRARGYFKTIAGEVIDRFAITRD